MLFFTIITIGLYVTITATTRVTPRDIVEVACKAHQAMHAACMWHAMPRMRAYTMHDCNSMHVCVHVKLAVRAGPIGIGIGACMWHASSCLPIPSVSAGIGMLVAQCASALTEGGSRG